MKPLIFISCGQVTQAEIKLGKALCSIIEADGRYEPYFAENQSSLEAVTANILAKLVSADAFVGVLHPRGDVRIPSADRVNHTITRASVWIEQEIAILAATAQLQRRSTRIQLYVKQGVAREGLRLFVMANPYEFGNEDAVASHFREVLKTWDLQLGPRALAAAEEEILGRSADVGTLEIVRSDRRGSFVRVAGYSFFDPADRAIAARYIEAVQVLLQHDLVRLIAANTYELTAAGFERARSIARDPAWLRIQPVVQLFWSQSRNEPEQLNVFVRNMGSLVPAEINLTIRFPRKYLKSAPPELESTDLVDRVEFRRSLSPSDVIGVQPGSFDTRVTNQRPIVRVPFWIEFGWSDEFESSYRKDMPEEVEITVEADQVTYAGRFVLEQLFDGEPGQYYAVARDESGLILL